MAAGYKQQIETSTREESPRGGKMRVRYGFEASCFTGAHGYGGYRDAHTGKVEKCYRVIRGGWVRNLRAQLSLALRNFPNRWKRAMEKLSPGGVFFFFFVVSAVHHLSFFFAENASYRRGVILDFECAHVFAWE